MSKRIVIFLIIACLLFASPVLAEGGGESGAARRTSDAAIEFIKSFEGFSEYPVFDVYGPAVGYGTHVAYGEWEDGITPEEADALMRSVIVPMEEALNARLGALGMTVTQNQFDALISLTYNCGTSWLGSRGLLDVLASGTASDGEIVNAFAGYCYVRGAVLEPLISRRIAEAKLYLYSDYLFGNSPEYEWSVTVSSAGDTQIRANPTGRLSGGTLSDIYYTQWFYGCVAELCCGGLVDGYEDGSFRPYGFVTTGEALKLLTLAAGYERQEAEEGEHWASGYLRLAVELGIVGQEDGVSLSAYADRGLVAELAAKSLALEPGGDEPFEDTDDPYVAALYNAGVVEGSYDKWGRLVYLPENPVSRAELCAIISRIINSPRVGNAAE